MRARGRAPPLWASGARARAQLRRVAAAFNDEHAPANVSAYEPHLCAHPIALHPVKGALEYARLTRALDVRDLLHEPLLRAWRRDVATSRARR